MYDFCEMFARCILDPHLLFFFEFFGAANLFSTFDSCTEIYDFSEMFARCILDPYLLCFEFSVLQICSILKSIHVSVKRSFQLLVRTRNASEEYNVHTEKYI